MTAEHWFPSHLRHLSEEECREQLALHQVGRFGYVAPDGPIIVPVNYTFHDGVILVATSAYSALAQHGRGAVAFEVDEIDEVTESGWSVVVRGHAEPVGADELPADVSERPRPWAEGNRRLHLRITPDEITGRRLLPS